MHIKIASVDELSTASRKVVSVGNVEIGVFKVRDKIVAWHNTCPHQGGPVCQGGIFKRVVEVLDSDLRDIRQDHHPEDVNIVCPWHGVEFDLLTGQVPAAPSLRLKPVKIEVRDGEIWVDV